MTNAQLFSQAHAMTKQIIKKGDSYNVTFGLCLKAIKNKQTNKKVAKNNVMILFVITFVMFINKTTKAIKKIFTAENIAGFLLVTPLVFMFVYFLAIIIAYSPTY